MNTEGPIHRRLNSWKPYDKITIELVPRLKTSSLSGDGWRVAAKTTLWFKGRAIVVDFRNSLDYAIANVAALVAEHSCPIDEQVIQIEEHACDQPSCAEDAVSRYKIRQLYSAQGEKLDASEGSHAAYHYRKFCARHLYRGDCDLEDCDRNYEVVDGPGPDHARDEVHDQSPSATAVVGQSD